MKRIIFKFIAVALTPLCLGIDPAWSAGMAEGFRLPQPRSSFERVSRGTYAFQTAVPPLDAGFDGTFIGNPKDAGFVRKGASRRNVLSIVTGFSLGFIPLSLAAKDKKKKKNTTDITRPNFPQGSAIERENILLTQEQLGSSWYSPDEALQANSYANFLRRVINGNPKVLIQFLEHRADWQELLSINRFEGKSLNVASTPTHAAGPTFEGKHAVIRDAAGFSGLVATNPQHILETVDLPATDTSAGFWRRLAHLGLPLLKKVAGGVEIYSKNHEEEAWFKTYEKAFRVRQANADLEETVQESYRVGRSHWLAYVAARQRVREREAELSAATWEYAYQEEAVRLETGLPGSRPAESLFEFKNRVIDAQAAVKRAQAELNAPAIGIVGATARNDSEITASAARHIQPETPQWTAEGLFQTLDPRSNILAERIAEETFINQDPETLAKNIETGKVPKKASALDASPLGQFPTIEQLASAVEADIALGASPRQRLLELQQGIYKTQIKELKEQQKVHWQLGAGFELSSAPLFLSPFNFNFNFPSPSTIQSLDELILALELRSKAIDAEIIAERVRLRVEFLQAREERRLAFIDLRKTQDEILQLDRDAQAARQVDALHTTTLNQDRLALQRNILEQKALGQAYEALDAWEKMKFFTPAAQQTFADELYHHYVGALHRLDPDHVVPKELDPAIPSELTKPVASLTNRRGFFELFKPLIQGVSAAVAIFVVLSAQLSAQTYKVIDVARSAASSAIPVGVSQAAQKIAIDVVVGRFHTGKIENTLGGIAKDLLQAQKEALGPNAPDVTRDSILDLAEKLRVANHIKDFQHVPQGTLHAGLFDSRIATHLPGQHEAFHAAVQNAAALSHESVHAVVKEAVTQAPPLASHTSWLSTWAIELGGWAHAASGWLANPTHAVALAAGAVLTVAVVSLARRWKPGASRRWLLPVAASVMTLFTLWKAPSVAKAFNSSERQAEAVVVKEKAKAAKKISEASPPNFAVSVINDSHIVQLPVQSNNPGKITYVNSALTTVPAGQPVVAPKALPYGDLRDEINAAYRRIHPEARAPLLDSGLLSVRPDELARAPFHIEYFNTENSVGAKFRERLFSLKEILNGYAYVKASADKVRAETGSRDLTLREKTLEELVELETRRFEALHTRLELEVTYAKQTLHVVPGTKVESETPVNVPGQPGVALFTVQDRTIVRVGLPPQDILALVSAPDSGVLKYVDQKGQPYYVPIQGLRQITVPGGVTSRNGAGPQSKTTVYDRNPNFGSEGTVTVELELAQNPFPKDSVPVLKGIYQKPGDEEPLSPAVPSGSTLVSAQLVDIPNPTTRRHDALASVIRQELAVVKSAEEKNKKLLADLDSHLPSDSAPLVKLREELEDSHLELEKSKTELEAELSAQSAGEPELGAKNSPQEHRLVVPTHPADAADAALLSQEFPGSAEAEQRTVWKEGDTVHIQVTGGVLWSPDLKGGKRKVYFPSIQQTFEAEPVNSENADQQYPYPERTWEVVLRLGKGLSLQKFKRLFHGLPTDKAVTYGVLQPDSSPSQPINSWEKLIASRPSWLHRPVWSGVPFLSGLFAFTGHPWGLLAFLITFVATAGAIIPVARRRQASRVGAFELPVDGARVDRVPERDSRKLILAILKELPGKLKNGDLKAPSRKTVLQPVRFVVQTLLKWASNRTVQHIVGLIFIGWFFVLPIVKNLQVLKAVIRGIENQPMIREIVPLTPNGVEPIYVIIFLVAVIFVSMPQRSGELMMVPLLGILYGITSLLDQLVTIPVRTIQWAVHHLRHEEKNQEIAATLDRQEFTDFIDLAHLGRFFLHELLARLDADPELARSVLLAFDHYNAKAPDRRHPGSGSLEMISPAEVRERLELEGRSPGSISSDDLDTARAKFTILHTLSRNSLAIRGLLALIMTGLVDDALPQTNDLLRRRAGFALAALVKTNLFPQVFNHYRRTPRKPKSTNLLRMAA